MSDAPPPGARIGLHAGSALPQTPDEMDALLRRVPEIAFAPELAGCAFSPDAIAALVARSAASQIIELAGTAWLARLRAALVELGARADLESNGGVRFLATALGHFVGTIRADEHPLIVALYCRALGQGAGRPDTPAGVAVAMDVLSEAGTLG